MGSIKEDTYLETVPDYVNKTQQEWDELSYHSQYYYAKEALKNLNRNLLYL